MVILPGEVAGQSFVSKYDGLNQVYFFVKNSDDISGNVSFTLEEEETGTIVESISSIDEFPENGFVAFEFPEIKNSNQRKYFASVTNHGTGSIHLGSANEVAYLNGSAYRNGVPIETQLTFKLGHEKWVAFLGLILEFLTWLLYLMVGILLLVLPGWGGLSWLLPGWERYGGFEKFMLSISFTLALIPIIFLWADIVHLPLGIWLPITMVSAGLILLLIKNWRGLTRKPKVRNLRSVIQGQDIIFSGVLFVVIAGLILSRFWVIRNLELPLWGDSYHHSLIVQLLDDHQGLFKDWLPYAELFGLSYHYGFHAGTVVFKWIVGFTSPDAILFFGQVMNILAVMALYPLAKMVSDNRWAGLAAILVGGLLLSLPNGYTNWGRYTQLTGQVLLPSTVLAVWMLMNPIPPGKEDIRDNKNILRILVFGWVVWCGLALIHIRVVVFAAAAIPFVFFLNVHKNSFYKKLLTIVLLAIGALILFLPWLPNILEGQLGNLITHYLRTPVNSTAGASIQDADAIRDVFSFLPAWAWIGMLITIGWGLWNRNKNVLWISSWWMLILLTANPGWLGIPGSGAITNFALLIAFYIPASSLIGGGAGWIQNIVEQKAGQKKILKTSFLLLLAFAILWGIRLRVADIDAQQNSLSGSPDLKAADWIRENVPEESRFYVNSFFAYGGTLVVGSDGGWWLPLIASRSTTLPPLTYGIEPGPVDDYIAYVNFLVMEVQRQGITDPDVINLFKEYGVTHIYIGQQQGSVNAPPGSQIDVNELLESRFFKPIYHTDRVWIFLLRTANEN